MEMEVVVLQQPQNMPQMTETGKSRDENKQKGYSKMERISAKIKRRCRKRIEKLRKRKK